MKRYTFIILLLCAVLSLNAQPRQELRAVWLTTLEGLDWPSTKGTSAAIERRQKQELCEILDKLKRANVNTVLFQARIRGTVTYPSKYEPWDGCISGKFGTAPNYDPLQYAIEEAHKLLSHDMASQTAFALIAREMRKYSVKESPSASS